MVPIELPAASLCSNPLSMQVHPNGLRHIRADRRINEWRAPGRRTIAKAATNERQVGHAHAYLCFIAFCVVTCTTGCTKTYIAQCNADKVDI